ncbi:hypothetical protein DMB91_04850 [Campylobacter sp. MIT 97-5078]|nr:hypothetical protein DMB91_04850 [Campylobacter sp. MIT 97-5078]
MVSKNIYLCDKLLYYYRFNPKSLTRAKENFIQCNKDCELVQKLLAKLALKHDEKFKFFVYYEILFLKIHDAHRLYEYNILTYPYLKFLYRFNLSIKKKYYNLCRKQIAKKFKSLENKQI